MAVKVKLKTIYNYVYTAVFKNCDHELQVETPQVLINHMKLSSIKKIKIPHSDNLINMQSNPVSIW